MSRLRTLSQLCLMAVTAFALGCDDGDGGGADAGQGGAGGAGAAGGQGGGGAGGAGAAGGEGGAGAAGGEGGEGGGQGGEGGAMCVDGTRSCPCGPADACDAGLICDRGFCVDDDTPPCDPGTQGCPCADGMCAAGLECTADVCAPAGCTPGAADCTCDNGNCDGELVCTHGICGMGGPPPTDGVHIAGAMVFGCDALFYEQGGAKVAAVTFDDAIIGEHLRRDGKLALSFISRGMPVVNVGAIILDGQRVATAADLDLRSLTCFDANGRAVDGARIVLE